MHRAVIVVGIVIDDGWIHSSMLRARMAWYDPEGGWHTRSSPALVRQAA